MKTKKQVCTFPYALHSTPSFNSRAYPVQRDGGSYSKPDYFVVWSPVHYPHYVGRYTTKAAAQKKADEVNSRKSEWIYCGGFNPADMQKVYDWLNQKQDPAQVAARQITRPEYEPHPETPAYHWCNQTQCYILHHNPPEA